MNSSVAIIETNDEFGVAQVLGRLWSGRWLIVSSMAFFCVVFGIAAYVMTPVYRATTILLPASSQEAGLGRVLGSALGSLGNLASMAGIGVGSDAGAVEEAMAVLRSRQFLEKFLSENNLLPVLYAGNWDALTNAWKDRDKVPTLAGAHKFFSNRVVSISRDTRTGLVTIYVDWRDREQAVEWVNELVERLNAEMRARALEKASASLGYLENELKRTTVVGTQDAINRLIEAQINQRMLANVTSEYAFRVVDRAMVPDEDDFVRPKRLILVVLGLLVGGILGAAIVLIRGAWAQPKTKTKLA